MAFFNKASDNPTINRIHQRIERMNNLLCHIENSLNQNGGLDRYNELRISTWLESLIEEQTETEILLRQLTTKEQQRLNLKWMDGRVLPLAVWNGSYSMLMAQLQRLFKEYCNK
ncbi:MAG: hypothetical protein LUE26_07015 [Alistipes sp.]|nr:hypothetical protein [Alistipes sp.]